MIPLLGFNHTLTVSIPWNDKVDNFQLCQKKSLDILRICFITYAYLCRIHRCHITCDAVVNDIYICTHTHTYIYIYIYLYITYKSTITQPLLRRCYCPPIVTVKQHQTFRGFYDLLSQQLRSLNRRKLDALPSNHTGVILCMCSANKRRRYKVTSSLIGWAHTRNDPWPRIIWNYGFNPGWICKLKDSVASVTQNELD